MKSYLSLVPISARVRRRKNRMTLLCIMIAVFLVTGIFSMVDAMNEQEKEQTAFVHGSWHIMINGLSKKEAKEIGVREDVAAASWFEVENLKMSDGGPGKVGKAYGIDGIPTAVCGVEEPFVTDIMHYFDEGASLDSEGKIILSEEAKELLSVGMGDTVTLDTPKGSFPFTVSGFRSSDSRWVGSNGGEDSALLVQDGTLGAFISFPAFEKIQGDEKTGNMEKRFYIRFQDRANIRRALSEISAQYGLEKSDIKQNQMLMASMGLGDSSAFLAIYGTAALLFVLVMLAGIFMIAGSLNSNIAERSQFFGMLRCIGASRRQVMHIVRMEALHWCRSAIPAGVLAGCAGSWGLCAFLKYAAGGDFQNMRVFRVSLVGIACGVCLGLVTVLLAAQAPARRAARVSPVAAVSGNAGQFHPAHGRGFRRRSAASGVRIAGRRGNSSAFRVETALGIHHAAGAKKNLVLMTCSFALSIILFLCFSVLVEFMGYVAPQKLYAPDLSVIGKDYQNVVDAALIEKLSGMHGVKEAFGRASERDVPAEFSRKAKQKSVELISYDELQLGWLEKDGDLRKGSDAEKVMGESTSVLTVYDMDNPLQTGDTICINGEELAITGMLKMSPFSNNGRTDGKIEIICSEETFVRLTGEKNYGIIDLHVTDDVTGEDVQAIKALAKEQGHEFTDRREEGEAGLFFAFKLAVYGFLLIIALISVFNIVNSISMSVSARTKQYGAMRAVGLAGRQLKRMIFAEAWTYAVCGTVVGTALGLLLAKTIHELLITAHFGASFGWSVPWAKLLLVLLLVSGAVVLAVEKPAGRIRRMAITETIGEL